MLGYGIMMHFFTLRLFVLSWVSTWCRFLVLADLHTGRSWLSLSFFRLSFSSFLGWGGSWKRDGGALWASGMNVYRSLVLVTASRPVHGPLVQQIWGTWNWYRKKSRWSPRWGCGDNQPYQVIFTCAAQVCCTRVSSPGFPGCRPDRWTLSYRARNPNTATCILSICKINHLITLPLLGWHVNYSAREV